MVRVMNLVGGIIKWIAYMWLITSEAFQEIFSLCTSDLLRNLLPDITGKLGGMARLQRKTNADDKQGILVAR